MYDVFIPILIFVAVMSFGGAALLARTGRPEPLAVRLGHPPTPAGAASRSKDGSGLLKLLARVGSLFSTGTPSRTLQAELAKAGFHSNNAPAIYLGGKILCLLIGATTLTVLLWPLDVIPGPFKWSLIVAGSGLLFFIPNLVVRARRDRRRNEIRAHLPDAIDLLEISVSAGMGLDAAWNAVADEARAVSDTLADEMALTDLEIHLGAPRAVAMRNMAQRTGAEEIVSLVSTLVQSERLGTSISDGLRTFAESMREARSNRAEEAAEKMPVKLLFPMILLIFPAVLIVIAGPAVIQWVKIIGGS